MKLDLEQIKFGVDRATFKRAVGLYESGKVRNFREVPGGYEAAVIGTQRYQVDISGTKFGHGNCDCYLGQQDILCKHIVAVALRAVLGGEPLDEEDKEPVGQAAASGQLGRLDEAQLKDAKRAITAAMRYVKPYDGPSRIWFTYQDSLGQGCARLGSIVSGLPASEQTARLLVDILLRLDRKLCESGVDDSDGTVGGFMGGVVAVLLEFIRLDHSCLKAIKPIIGRRTCFEWESPLVKMWDESRA